MILLIGAASAVEASGFSTDLRGVFILLGAILAAVLAHLYADLRSRKKHLRAWYVTRRFNALLNWCEDVEAICLMQSEDDLKSYCDRELRDYIRVYQAANHLDSRFNLAWSESVHNINVAMHNLYEDRDVQDRMGTWNEIQEDVSTVIARAERWRATLYNNPFPGPLRRFIWTRFKTR